MVGVNELNNYHELVNVDIPDLTDYKKYVPLVKGGLNINKSIYVFK